MHTCFSRAVARLGMLIGVIASSGALSACNDLLVVDPPSGVQAGTPLKTLEGAEQAFAGGKADLFIAFAGSQPLVQFSGLLTDEFTWTNLSQSANHTNIDARATTILGGYLQYGGFAITKLLLARSELLMAATGLQRFEPPAGQGKVGEALALVGYAELLVAEDYCAGVPLTAELSDGGVSYGMPLSTDSLLAVAQGHFDSALAHAAEDPTVTALASIGRARVLLDRGKYQEASTGVSGVATSFVYNAEFSPTRSASAPSQTDFYSVQLPINHGCGQSNVGDREGANGLDFVSARDPRLAIDSTISQTCDGIHGGVTPGTWYYPVKFGNPSSYVALATGVEARLIEAEAALQGENVSQWAQDLNALRDAASSTYLQLTGPIPALTIDSTSSASSDEQVDVMFRERAFWLFGTGTRLGDLRRLVRQYGRDAESVFPTGPYANGHDPHLPSPLANYGTDVSLSLPVGADFPTTNPNYRGCLGSPSTP